MPRLVMKFGGTSVATVERIRNVARHVKREVEAGYEVAVVVSAMAGKTNELVAWCKEASGLFDPREYDVVVASGEQVTSGLLAIVLQEMGVPARSWQGWQIPILTSDAHGSARIADIDGAAMRKSLAGRQVALGRDPLETGDHRDAALLEHLLQHLGVDMVDERAGVAAGVDRKLPAHVGAGVESHALQGDGEQPAGHLLAAGDDHVILSRIVKRCGFAAELDEPVGFTGHGGDDDGKLVAALGLALHERRDMANALDARHRGAAELHYDAGHARGE